MNIYTQICGLSIIALLLFFYKRQPTMGLSSERRFITTLYVILVCIILDIMSCYFIINSARYNELMVIGMCKLYLLSLQAVSFSALKYAVSDIIDTLGSRHEKLIDKLYNFLFVLGLVVTAYLPLDYYFNGQVLYSFGSSAMATYIIVAFYMLSIVFATVVLKKYIKPSKINAILFWMALWCAAASLQFAKPKLLLVSFASSLGALVVYFELENPQRAISRRTGHFSSSVIREYLDYLYQHGRTFSAMMISFRTVGDASTENKLLRKTIELLSDFLFSIDTAKVFDTAEGYFLLIFENTNFMESTKFKIATYFQSVEDNKDIENAITLLNPFYTIVPNGSIAENSDELLMLLSSFVPSNHEAVIKNEVIIDSEAVTNLRRRKHVEKMVIEAMEDDRIEVHYQPIYDMSLELFTSVEALVRIRLSDGRLIFPEDFIPVMEETGRIIPLSDSIYKKVLSFIRSYRIEKLGVERIELNLSVKQGESPVFVSRFLDQLKKHSIDPDLINLEITETSSMSSRENLLNNMNKLLEQGITFSLDDFGSGSSNLNYIIDMPITIVKLDKHLTHEYISNEKARAIVKTVVEMSHSMGIKLIAEGIETEEQLNDMRFVGVDYIQGYYFSRPLPEHEYLKFIQINNLCKGERYA